MDPLLVTEPSPDAGPPQPLDCLPPAVRAWFESRPVLRPVNLSFQRMEGRPVYVLEDPVSSAIYRIGEKEYRFVECLDGLHTVADILLHQEATRPGESLDPENAIRLLEMLQAEKLLDDPARSASGDGKQQASVADRLGGLLFLRLSFGNPDRFFIWLARWLGWAVHPVAWLLGLGLIFFGGLTVWRHVDRVRDATLGVLAPNNWLWIGIIFLALRACHEAWHGLVCRRLGGRVRDIGVVLIVFLPLGFVDVTSSWTLPSRWLRLLVSSAGIFCELCLAAIAALVWAHTGPGLANTLAWQVVLTAGVSSLLVNANPLMRFDGYYILTDVLDLPNLFTRGQMLLRRASRRCLFGLPGAPMPPLGTKGWIAAAIYGPANLAWRFFIIGNLLLAALMIGRGAGIALVAITLGAWGRSAVIKHLRGLRALPTGVRITGLIRVAGLLVVLGSGLLLPWHPNASEPAVIDWAERVDVYAGCPGTVAAINVEPGEAAAMGQEIVQLENADLMADAERASVRVRQAELNGRLALREDDMPDWVTTQAAGRSLRESLAHATKKASLRSVTAPAEGVVYSPIRPLRLGQFVREGNHLFTLGHASEREAIALVAQDRLELYGLRIDDTVNVYIAGYELTVPGRILSIDPVARRSIEHPALTSLGGGRLSVRLRSADEKTRGGGKYMLQDPQFEVRVLLKDNRAGKFLSGMRCRVAFGSAKAVPFWFLAYAPLERFWHRILTPSN